MTTANTAASTASMEAAGATTMASNRVAATVVGLDHHQQAGVCKVRDLVRYLLLQISVFRNVKSVKSQPQVNI